MKTSVFGILLLITMLLLPINTNAQIDKDYPKRENYQSLNASYIVGGQVFNDNFIYNPGFSVDVSTGFFVNENIGIGLGTNYKSLETVSFLPIYGEIIGYKNKKNTSFINMKLGYSLAWDKNEIKVEDYELKGGVFISVGMGRKIKVNNNYSLLLHWSYQHQFAKMEYSIFSTQEYLEVLNFDMIVISIGLMKERR